MTSRSASITDIDGELAETDFRLVADLIHREAGIVVRENKQAMVRGRLVRRARELGLPSLNAYCQRLKGPSLSEELPGLLNALTTNHTAFYREEHHFEHLDKVALPALMGSGRRERFRVWCAAASTGEEPYTIAATVHAHLGGARHPDLLVLATDLDSEVIATAERGLYPAAAMDKLSVEQRRRLNPTPDRSDLVRLDASFKTMLRFRQLNILHDWPFSGPFQIIFCRNMLIYFDTPTKLDVVNRMTAMLAPGGYLYLGHSEALPGAVKGLRACGRTTYVRS